MTNGIMFVMTMKVLSHDATAIRLPIDLNRVDVYQLYSELYIE